LPVISCGVSPAFRTTTLANPWLAIIGVLHNPPSLLGGSFAFVDQAAEDGSAFDPFRWGIGDRVVGLGWLVLECAVWASSVVVLRVLG
jgi:hypothetical protein